MTTIEQLVNGHARTRDKSDTRLLKYEIQSAVLERAMRLEREADLLTARARELESLANGEIEELFSER